MGSKLRLAATLALAALSWTVAVLAYQRSMRPTFARDIAPIGLLHCAPCHRPGQSAPFSLLEYEDYREHASDIADVVEDRYMPPWKPSDHTGKFIGERGLSREQIALIRRWVDEGKQRGDPGDLPEAPAWSAEPDGFALGEPDLVLQLPAAYVQPATGADEYRNFVIPSSVNAGKYVVGWELKPRSRAVHHAILMVDRLGNARRADEADPGPGFADMDFAGAQAPDGFYLVWAPGKSPSRSTDGSAWRLDPSTDLVLQLHLQRTGKPESIQPLVALYFSDRPPTIRRCSLRIGDQVIDIPPGERAYTIEDRLVLPVDVRVLGLFPHAHYLAKTMRVWSQSPDGTELELLRIDDWDFNWQDEYSFREPPLLLRGSTLQMRFTYDNSSANPHQPNIPPQRVRDGKRSLDEMGNVTFQLSPRDPSDIEPLLEAKYRRVLALSGKPSAEALYNLANTLARQNKLDEAVHYYEAVLERDPSLLHARYNLSGLLATHGRSDGALRHVRSLLAERPDYPGARLLLGHILEERGELDAAIETYRSIASSSPEQNTARALLEAAQRRRSERQR